ncbi:tRNA (N(6)-L-threonylcarbamoyladenosine(37)-C(2))-methylthiotransferase, partial [Candidatus Woesearchaeota archaeon]
MARIFIKTYGCTHNVADSERMGGLLEQAGHELVEERASADVVLVNSCTVKDPAEKRFWHEISLTKNAGQLLVIAGCVPQSQPGNEQLAGLPTVGVKEIERVVEVVEGALAGKAIRATSHRNQPGLSLPRTRRNPLIEIIPINDGCLGSCTYCATVLARGRLRSHPQHEIINAIRAATREGVKEVWLTSEDVGAWGRDIGEELPTLLNAIATIPGEFMVRIGMANPPFLKEYVSELITLFRAHPRRFFRFLHIPVQSGSNRVLRAMKREYTVQDFLAVVEPLKQAFPEMT